MKTIIPVKRGNTIVKIYRRKAGHYKGKYYDLFTVAYRQHGQRVLRNFRRRRAAYDFASETATRLEKGEREILRASAADWQSYLAARNLLRPFGIPLHEAIEEYVANRKRNKIVEKRVGN